MSIAIPHAIRFGGRSPEQAAPATMPELTMEQQLELYGEWVKTINRYTTSAEARDDTTVGDYLVHPVKDKEGLISATRMYTERDDEWVPSALQAVFPNYKIITSVLNDNPQQPFYVQILTHPETDQTPRLSHETLHAFGDELGTLALAGFHRLTHHSK